jgi:deoxyribose-phosphate aldolase
VNGVWVPSCVDALAGTGVAVASVVGFPLGACGTASKVDETGHVVDAGAAEVDMVLDLGGLKSGDLERVRADVAAVADRAHTAGAVVKVIIETCLLDDDEKATACRLAVDAGADYVKTSTGFSTGGATVHDVALMRSVVGGSIGVKASGGVRTAEAARAMIEAGATRIGTSSGLAIVGA